MVSNKPALQILLGVALSFSLTGCYVDHSDRGHREHARVVEHDVVYVQPVHHEHHDEPGIDVHIH